MEKLLCLIGMLLLLSGCSSALGAVDKLYPMQDFVYDAAGNTSSIFRAYQTSVENVAKEIAEEEEPLKVANHDSRTILIYDEHLVQVYQDIEDTNDVLVEVSEEDFVKQNYTQDYFSTYEIADAADEAYDLDDRDDGEYYYTGYIGSGGYVKNTGIPTVRFGSSVSNSVRGGGPGAGK